MDLFPQHLGFRPDEPKVVKDNNGCAEYIEYVGYTQKLLEAYHSRATHNRVWIYVSPT